MTTTLEGVLVSAGFTEAEARKVVEDVAGVVVKKAVFDVVMREVDPSYKPSPALDPELVEQMADIVRKARATFAARAC